MRVGVKTSTSQPHSADPWESTMSPQGMSYPSIQQTLVNHLQLQSSMQSPHLTDTATTASHTTTWYSPALMTRVLWDPVNDTAHIPVPMPEVQSPQKQMLNLQYMKTCATTSHLLGTSSSLKHRMMMMIPSPLMSISRQHHSMMMSGLKEKFQIDACASMRDLMIQTTSVPTLVHMIAQPSSWTYCNPLCKMKQCLIMNRWSSVTSPQTFLISSWQWVMLTSLILQMFLMQYGLHKHSHWLYLQKLLFVHNKQ